MTRSAVKKKQMKDLIYSTLVKLEKNGENVTLYILKLLNEFQGKKNKTDYKKMRKHVNINSIPPNKHKKIKKNAKNDKRTRSNSTQHVNINHVAQKKKKVKKKRKIASIRDDDEYIDKTKLKSVKKWFIAPKRPKHIRTKSDPSTPKDSHPLTPSSHKKKLSLLSTKSANPRFPDTVHSKTSKKKTQRTKLRIIKSNESRKRSKVKKHVKTKKNVNMDNKRNVDMDNKKVKKRVYYIKEKRVNEPKQSKNQKSMKRPISKSRINKAKRIDIKNKDYIKKKPEKKNKRKPKLIKKKLSRKPSQIQLFRRRPGTNYSEEYYF